MANPASSAGPNGKNTLLEALGGGRGVNQTDFDNLTADEPSDVSSHCTMEHHMPSSTLADALLSSTLETQDISNLAGLDSSESEGGAEETITDRGKKELSSRTLLGALNANSMDPSDIIAMDPSDSEVTNGQEEEELERMLRQAQRLALQMQSVAGSNEGGKPPVAPKVNMVSSTPPEKKKRIVMDKTESLDVRSFATANEFSQTAAKTQVDAAELAVREMEAAVAALAATNKNPQEVPTMRSPSSTPRQPKSSEWEKVESAQETDDDFVPLKDYSKPAEKRGPTRTKRVDASGVTWEKVDYCEASDEDYVPLQDYSRKSSMEVPTSSRSVSRATPVRKRRKRRRRRILAAMMVVVLAFSVGYYFLWYLPQKNVVVAPHVAVTVSSKPMIVEQKKATPESPVAVLERKQHERRMVNSQGLPQSQGEPSQSKAVAKPSYPMKCQYPLAYLLVKDCSPVPRGSRRLEIILNSMMQ